jgi:hypothetical protein
MTKGLASVIGELKDGASTLVFARNGGMPISRQNGRTWLGDALDNAGLRQHGPHAASHRLQPPRHAGASRPWRHTEEGLAAASHTP